MAAYVASHHRVTSQLSLNTLVCIEDLPCGKVNLQYTRVLVLYKDMKRRIFRLSIRQQR